MKNYVYMINNPLAITELQYDACFNSLPVYRQEKAEAFHFRKDRVLSVLAGALLTYALRESFGLTEPGEIIEGDNGKPMIREYPGICFNLSHCQAAVVCAVSEGNAGIDVQETRAGLLRITDRFFSEKEKQMIKQEEDKDDQMALCRRIWTLKEAWGKYTGKGIMYDLRSRDFSELIKGHKDERLIHELYEEKQVLMTDDGMFAMSVISDLPMKVKECTIAELCDGMI